MLPRALTAVRSPACVRSSSSPVFKPKEGEVVAIYSKHAGKYLEVSPRDGRLRATADKPTNRTALFRVMVLTAPMVDILLDAAHTANSAEWSKRRHWTGPRLTENGTSSPDDKGCQCSGYSNDHGFGAYCFGCAPRPRDRGAAATVAPDGGVLARAGARASWEYEAQAPWCYVTDGCTAQETRGSFGRK
jgi:hypothetical protein